MSEDIELNDYFIDWHWDRFDSRFKKSRFSRNYDSSDIESCWNTATEAMQAKLDAQAEELAALRGFVLDIRENYLFTIGTSESFNLFLKHGFIDVKGNPTPLLTGKKE
jgi:hypothetical protein